MIPLEAPPDLVRGDYSIYQYTPEIYKIIRFRSNLVPVKRLSSEVTHHETKLESSLSRSRRVLLELALCNRWEWFCTFTIDGLKYDRSVLSVWYKRYSQWLRDQRKKGLEVSYVIVPERHKDGSWHAHGLMAGNMELISFAEERLQGLKVPDKLVDGGYLDWPAYREKFGFCSFGAIKNPVAAGFYVTKYLTKEQDRMVSIVGAKSYYAGQGLNRAVKHGEVFGYCAYLDQFLENHYDFCDTGMTHLKDGTDWTFGLEYMNCDLEPLEVAQLSPEQEEPVNQYMEAVQEVISGFMG